MKVSLTSTERAALRAIQKTARERWVYVRVTAVLMVDQGLTVSQTADLLGIDDNTVYRTLQDYRAKSGEGFLSRGGGGSSSLLSFVQIGGLSRRLGERLFRSAREVCDWVADEFGIAYSESGMVKLLNRIGYTYKQTKQVPCEANPERQREFLDTTLAKALEDEQAPLYYVDAVHPTHNTRSCHAWIARGSERALPTVSGRDRVNINGAVNARKPEEVLADFADSINAQSTIALYGRLIKANPGKAAIYVVGDNARYYRSKVLSEWLKGKPIKQLFLPPYSPNLNLAERLWKFMRKTAIDPVFYRTKAAFRAGVLAFFQNIAQHKQALDSLLTMNFHIVGA